MTTAVKPKDVSFVLRAPPDLIECVDIWRGLQPGVPNRTEAVRRILQAHIDSAGIKPRSKETTELDSESVQEGA